MTIKTHLDIRPYNIKPFLKGYFRPIIEPVFFARNVDFVSHDFVMANIMYPAKPAGQT